jgi:hypothetical protein
MWDAPAFAPVGPDGPKKHEQGIKKIGCGGRSGKAKIPNEEMRVKVRISAVARPRRADV